MWLIRNKAVQEAVPLEINQYRWLFSQDSTTPRCFRPFVMKTQLYYVIRACLYIISVTFSLLTLKNKMFITPNFFSKLFVLVARSISFFVSPVMNSTQQCVKRNEKWHRGWAIIRLPEMRITPRIQITPRPRRNNASVIGSRRGFRIIK